MARALSGVVILLGVAMLVLHLAGVAHRWATATAVLRGALQLAAISVILTGMISHPGWVAVALAVMFTVAVITSTRRLGRGLRRAGMVAGYLGATPRQATRDIARDAIREAAWPPRCW